MLHPKHGNKEFKNCSTFPVVTNGKYCCPKIYFNHRCFSGPYLNKGRIAELPQSVGPGNCVLVLKEVRAFSKYHFLSATFVALFAIVLCEVSPSTV